MRTIQIHPLSLLAGVAIALLAFVAMGQKQVPSAVAVVTPSGMEELVRPSDYVRIAEGTPYQVPAGKRFILRALGRTESPASFQTCLRIDGTEVLLNRSNGGTPGTVQPYPAGVFAEEGSVVEIWTNNWPGGGVAYGLGVAYGFEESMASAKQYVQVEEGTPFMVPSGKLFVPTAATSRDDYSPSLSLFLDGVKEMDIGEMNMAALPKGLAISEGVTLTIELGVTGADDARLWGYLVDA